MTESQWTRKICHELIECGCLVFAAVGNKFSTVGWPDRHVIMPTGEMFWLEFKSDEGKLTRPQKYMLIEINRRASGHAFVVRMPGILETETGVFVADFMVGRDLFFRLRGLRCDATNKN
jgi:hypothetical protein